MPRTSEKQKLLQAIDILAVQVAEKRLKNLQEYASTDDLESESDEDWAEEDTSTFESESDDDSLIFMSSPEPMTPNSESSVSSASESLDSQEEKAERYHCLLGAIQALRSEVESARVVNNLLPPPIRASQIHLLEHFAEFRPHLFRKMVRVDADIFDCILDEISGSPVFRSGSNRPQLPIAIQLAIFLNRVGHYGNAATPEDFCQWSGYSVGTIINCTNRVMLALLSKQTDFIGVPAVESEDFRLAHEFVEERTCAAWKGGVFATDGSAINLFAKPSHYGDTFTDRKGRYSMNCQVRRGTCLPVNVLLIRVQVVVMVHNLFIVDFGLGHPGSVHDAHAFQGTHIAQEPDELIPEGHWIWADSAYPTKTWCVVPFKAFRGSPLSRPKNLYNRYLSKVRTLFGLLPVVMHRDQL